MSFPRSSLVILALVSLSMASGIPKNAKLEVRLNQGLSSDNSNPGESFTATLDRAITLGDNTVLRKGSQVQGVVRYAESTYGYTRAGELELELVSVTSDGQLHPITTHPLLLTGRSDNADPNARKTDAIQAATGAIGPAPRGMSRPIPGTNVAVGGGGTGMQVILPPKTKLSFIVLAAPN